MPDLLHQFLDRGFQQTRDRGIMGESFTLGSVTAVGFFTPLDEQLSMELTGFLDTMDLAITARVADFATRPTINSELVHGGHTYRLRGIKEDQSAYILGFKKVST